MPGCPEICRALIVGMLVACTPPAPSVTPAPATVVPAVTVVDAAGPAMDVQTRVCGERKRCALRRGRPAGVDPSGQALTVWSVDLGVRSSATDRPDAANDDGFSEEETRDSFTATAIGRCREIEYWLAVGPTRAPATVQLLLTVCNDGNGAAGLGEDTVTIGARSFEHASSGGSNWRWSRTRVVDLAPLRLREVSSDAYFALGPNRERRHWSFDRFVGDVSWYSPPCDRGGAPLEVAEAAQLDRSYASIPAVTLPDEYAGGGWKAVGIGHCALALVTPDQPGDATMRVVAAAGAGTRALFVELEDDHFTRDDRLELWLTDRRPDYMAHCLAGEPAGLRQWTIDVSDGRVVAGHGQPEVAGLIVAVAGLAPLRLRLEPRSSFAGLTLVYVDRDDGEREPRRLLTSQLAPGHDDTLGALVEVDPQAAGCTVAAGRLEPVLRAFTGPGPVLP